MNAPGGASYSVETQKRRTPLWHKLLRDARFHELLLEADRQIAAEVHGKGCPVCCGKLHVAAYPRKPRSGIALRSGYERRFSFCCAEDGCRKRVTPASLRFLGRRVYLGLIVVLVAALRHGPSPTRVRKLRELTGVSRRTVERWCRWWRNGFVETPFWQMARAEFAEPVAEAALPSSLLERFAGDHQERLHALLRFLSPLGRSG